MSETISSNDKPTRFDEHPHEDLPTIAIKTLDNKTKWILAPSKLEILEKAKQEVLTAYDILLMEARLRSSYFYRPKLKPLSLWDKCKAIFKRKLKSK